MVPESFIPSGRETKGTADPCLVNWLREEWREELPFRSPGTCAKWVCRSPHQLIASHSCSFHTLSRELLEPMCLLQMHLLFPIKTLRQNPHYEAKSCASAVWVSSPYFTKIPDICTLSLLNGTPTSPTTVLNTTFYFGFPPPPPPQFTAHALFSFHLDLFSILILSYCMYFCHPH